jgi:hypothetical protein
MGLIHWGVPEQYVLDLKKASGAKCFLETGTFRGNTTKWAAGHFDHVYTIELSETLFRENAPAFTGLNNVTSLFGDTREHLLRIASTLPKTIFWLDAHWCGEVGAVGFEDQCPLLDEIAVLQACWDRAYILVDDARFFLAPPAPPHRIENWPTMSRLVKALDQGADRFVATFEDVLVSLPADARDVTTSYIHSGGTLNERVLGMKRPVPEPGPPHSLLHRVAMKLARAIP